MDQFHWTPNKNKMNCESVVMLSPITKTPVQQNNIRLKKSFQHSTSNLSFLPSHITPPSGFTKFVARNPFEADLTSKLHISVMSPTVFTKAVSPAQNGSPKFSWSIDELALMQPAKIDEFPTQQMHCSDPEMEKNAQEAISRFFSENQIIPSPFEIKKNECNLRRDMDLKTPTGVRESIYEPKENHDDSNTKESWTQTVLSLPPVLAPSVEEILKPYFNFTQDQNCDSEEINTSNTSLRRKLFFENHDDSHNESSDSIIISPIKTKSPLSHCLSPPQSGMFFHGTPLRNRPAITQRTYGSPLAYNEDSSPCSVSPICNPTLNMSCQSIKLRSKAKLDFTKDMSIEISYSEENHDDSVKEDNCKTLFSEEIQLVIGDSVNEYGADKENCDITKMIVSNDNSFKFKCGDKENAVSNSFSINDKSKLTEIHKTDFSESYAMQQSNMLSGNCVQPMAFSSTQDTGYQTYNSSNITSNFDSYSNSIKQKLCWGERTVQADDEVQLTDWKENIKNVISSTPSKFRCMNGI